MEPTAPKGRNATTIKLRFSWLENGLINHCDNGEGGGFHVTPLTLYFPVTHPPVEIVIFES